MNVGKVMFTGKLKALSLYVRKEKKSLKLII